MKIRILLPAGSIPVGSTVTKRTGEKPYVIRDQITIYTTPPQVIKAGNEARFIVSEDGNVNVVAMDTDLLWSTNAHDFADFLEIDAGQ